MIRYGLRCNVWIPKSKLVMAYICPDRLSFTTELASLKKPSYFLWIELYYQILISVIALLTFVLKKLWSLYLVKKRMHLIFLMFYMKLQEYKILTYEYQTPQKIRQFTIASNSCTSSTSEIPGNYDRKCNVVTNKTWIILISDCLNWV